MCILHFSCHCTLFIYFLQWLQCLSAELRTSALHRWHWGGVSCLFFLIFHHYIIFILIYLSGSVFTPMCFVLHVHCSWQRSTDRNILYYCSSALCSNKCPSFSGMRVVLAFFFLVFRGQSSVGILVPIPELGSSVSQPQELNFQIG